MKSEIKRVQKCIKPNLQRNKSRIGRGGLNDQRYSKCPETDFGFNIFEI